MIKKLLQRQAVRLGIVMPIVTAVMSLGVFVTPAHAATCDQYSYGYGGNGTCVLYIQKLLNLDWYFEHFAGGSTIAEDGQFGTHTRTDVKAFQTSDHLSSDGIVGPHTWAALCDESYTFYVRLHSTDPHAVTMYNIATSAGCFQ